jgi:hypothetical protein
MGADAGFFVSGSEFAAIRSPALLVGAAAGFSPGAAMVGLGLAACVTGLAGCATFDGAAIGAMAGAETGAG